ncbi:MAG: MATE family efflux transporter [Planctomycetota bacterium]
MYDLQRDSRLASLAEVLKLSWPAGLTMLNTTVVKFVDGVMVSRVGPEPFAAQFVGGMWSFVPESFILGVLTVINTFVAQNLGAGRYRRCGQYAWAGIAIAVTAAVFAAPLALPAGRLFALLGHDPTVTALETMYFRYMILTLGITLSSRSLEQFFFGIHRPGIVLAASLIGNACNVGGNYVLIFGKLGLPAMGLQGAAIGTIVAWCVQLGVLAAVFASPSMHTRYCTRWPNLLKLRHIRNVVRIGWPAGIQLWNDVASWIVFTSVLVGTYFGTAHLTATVAVVRYMSLSFMPAVGIGSATTALVGRYIGAALPGRAKRRTHTALAVAMGYMGFCALVFVLFRHQLVDFFVQVDPATPAAEAGLLRERIVDIGGNIMLCAAAFQLFDALGIVYIGALRGAGDTRWPMLVTLAFSWGVFLVGGLLLANLLPQLTSLGPWLAGSAYIILLGAVLAWRFESGAWRRIDLLGSPGAVEKV